MGLDLVLTRRPALPPYSTPHQDTRRPRAARKRPRAASESPPGQRGSVAEEPRAIECSRAAVAGVDRRELTTIPAQGGGVDPEDRSPSYAAPPHAAPPCTDLTSYLAMVLAALVAGARRPAPGLTLTPSPPPERRIVGGYLRSCLSRATPRVSASCRRKRDPRVTPSHDA